MDRKTEHLGKKSHLDNISCQWPIDQRVDLALFLCSTRTLLMNDNHRHNNRDAVIMSAAAVAMPPIPCSCKGTGKAQARQVSRSREDGRHHSYTSSHPLLDCWSMSSSPSVPH